MKKLFLGLSMVGAVASSFGAGIPLETFDTYADTAALNAAWTVDAAGITLKTDGGHSGSNYIQTTGDGATVPGRISKVISLDSTNNSPIEVSFWIRVPSLALGRSYIQLEAPGTQLVNFGLHNSPAGSNWFIRTVGGGTPGAWSGSDGTVARVANTWVNLKAVVKERDVTYYADNTELVTHSRTSTDWPVFTVFRVGFNIGSSAIPVDFDDIEVKQTIATRVSDWNLY